MTDDMVCFTNRRVAQEKVKPASNQLFEHKPQVSEDGYVRARKAAPGYDIHGLYQEWVGWWRDSGSPELTSPDAAFSAFAESGTSASRLARLVGK
jgi:hypothetical protein